MILVFLILRQLLGQEILFIYHSGLLILKEILLAILQVWGLMGRNKVIYFIKLSKSSFLIGFLKSKKAVTSFSKTKAIFNSVSIVIFFPFSILCISDLFKPTSNPSCSKVSFLSL